YIEHVQAMFALLGDAAQTAAANAKVVMEIETALAEASLIRVDKRDPYKINHKLTKAKLQALTPSFAWEPYLKDSGAPSIASVNVTEPKFFEKLESLLKSRSLDDWKTYLRWHAAHEAAPYLSNAFVTADYNFYLKYLRGVAEMQPRWRRCVRYTDD